MTFCQCDHCLRARARAIVALADRGITDWWLHNREINEAALRACEEARSSGYQDPVSLFPRGIPS